MLAVALTRRGARVDVLQCDASLPACQACELSWFPEPRKLVREGPGKLCSTCYPPGHEMFDDLGLNWLGLGGWLGAEDAEFAERESTRLPLDGIGTYQLDGVPVGEHALAGALRFFARGDLDSEPTGNAILRRYLEAAIRVTRATTRLLRAQPYDVVVLNHGIYVPQGIIAAVARRHKVRVVTWHPAYRRGCFVFSEDDSYHHTMMTEPTSVWENLPWSEALEERLGAYLKSRWTGADDWIWFHEQPRFDSESIRAELGLDPDKPLVGLLTNVVWDAQLHYPANAFPDMLDWLFRTIEYFRTRPDLQLLIRVHPAEIHGGLPSRQKAADEIAARFPQLPDNVFVVPPESSISTYAACSMCDSVLIYGTKTGVELTSMGIPVIVAGEAWIRGKGIADDASDADEYFRMLDALPKSERLPADVIQRARRYAFHFFFRRMIPVGVMRAADGWPPYQVEIDGLEALAPGNDAGLDVVCDGILEGTGFVYPAERETSS